MYVVYCLLQIADGCFTYIGVSRLGLAGEGNPILRAGFATFGVGVTLAWAKAAAMFIPLGLPLKAWHLLWFVNVLYLTFALLPWMWVFYSIR